MDAMAEMMQMEEQILKMEQYGASGGKDNRGIMTQIKADDLPDEAVNVFSNAPLAFEESVSILWNATQKLYYHACKANRFSENYLKYSGELEKSIRQMGSYCLTKAALEQKGMTFQNLAELSIKELVGMVSYHVRKANAAFEGIYKDNDILGLSYLQQEFRWVILIDRLKATDAKIQKLKDGKLDADELLKQDENFRNLPRTNEKSDPDLPKRLQINPSALPINGSMAREMLKQEAADQKKAEAVQKEKLRKLRELEKLERTSSVVPGGFNPPAIFPVDKEGLALANRERAERLRREIAEMEAVEAESEPPQDEPEQEQLPRGALSEAEARKLLMDEAIRRGDQQAILEIPLEDSDTFYQRWLRRNEEVRKRNLINMGAAGVPLSNTRKALREKRKKKRK